MCSVLPLPRCRRRHGALTGPHGHIVEKQETFDFVLTLNIDQITIGLHVRCALIEI